MQEDRQSPCPVESSTLVPGGAADRSAHSAGPVSRVMARVAGCMENEDEDLESLGLNRLRYFRLMVFFGKCEELFSSRPHLSAFALAGAICQKKSSARC